MTSGTAGIPSDVLSSANCIAVVPGLVKGAFIVGGEHGGGVATCRTPRGWSAPALFKISGASLGLQAGGQKTDLRIILRRAQAGSAPAPSAVRGASQEMLDRIYGHSP